MTWFDLTGELKSTYNLWIIPELWLPTWTLTSGFNCQVAVTTWVKSPRVTGAVWNCGAVLWSPVQCQTAKPPVASTTAISNHFHQPDTTLLAIKSDVTICNTP